MNEQILASPAESLEEAFLKLVLEPEMRDKNTSHNKIGDSCLQTQLSIHVHYVPLKVLWLTLKEGEMA